jgi:hypothetical protein
MGYQGGPTVLGGAHADAPYDAADLAVDDDDALGASPQSEGSDSLDVLIGVGVGDEGAAID